jgi:predicted amidohydrolase YtcJ
VTSFQDAGSTFEVIDFYKKLAKEEKLGVRLWVMVNEENDQLETKLADYKIIGPLLTVRAVKTYIDGALGAHGAWLLEPYNDMPQSSGMLVTPVELITRTAQLAIQHGFQLGTHAIGDKGNRVILDIYKKVFGEYPEKKGLRFRVEHAQHLHPDDIARFKKLEVIASMQGIHCTSDGPWVEKRLGKKRAEEGAYAWRKLIDSGAIVSNGTDTPVEDVDPIANFHALVTRRMKNGEAFYPEQSMTREEALRAYTLNAAYAAFEENSKGSLTPGKLADIVVLSRDILSVPENDILKAEVLYTIVGGKIVHQKK